MKCDKCGNPVTETDRICKHCGELNRHNPNNAHVLSLMKHSNNARNNAFESSINKNALRQQQAANGYKNQIKTEGVDPQELAVPETPVQEQPTAPKKPSNVTPGMHVLNLLTVGAAIALIYMYLPKFLIPGIISAIISLIYLYSADIILKKANEKWWANFIPVYNLYVWNKVALRNGWMWMILLVPSVLILGAYYLKATMIIPTLTIVEIGVAITYYLMFSSKLAYRFATSGILMILFAPFVFPYIAFSERRYYDK